MGLPRNQGVRILSLEDSDLDAELILHELRKGGIEFVWSRVQTGDEFEHALSDFQPQIILADYKLPTFNGALALAIAKERCPDVPVIIISGAVGEEIAVELLRNGATDFLLKDRLGRLAAAVDRALSEVEEQKARRKADADLRKLNEELEQRVAERTRELREKNTIMEEELKMARELQMALLPQDFPTFPQGAEQAASDVKFCSLYRPTSSVSGDFFNVVRVSDTAVGVFICDVMGHGVRAALVTSMMRALEERLGGFAGDPGALLSEINRALRCILRPTGITLFTTACYILADVGTSRITVANAGHPSPLLVRSAPGIVVPLTAPRSRGPALGLIEDVRYHNFEYPLAMNDLVLLFTDGLFEVENADAEPFGVDRLHESVRRRAGMPPAALVQDVFTEVESFAVDHVFHDDVCLVGMEIARLKASAA
jgi:phosphoserine phosphatase RsbU/P